MHDVDVMNRSTLLVLLASYIQSTVVFIPLIVILVMSLWVLGSKLFAWYLNHSRRPISELRLLELCESVSLL